MNNLNPKLRNALGISALTALSLAMVGCGGSSSSAPAATNSAPGSVTISGANTAVQYHPSLYNLSAVDPEGDAITFTATTTNGTAVVGTGATASLLTFTPATVAAASTITVIATDSKGAVAPAKTIFVAVTPNTPATFTSTPPTAPLVVGQTLTYTPVTAIDPQNDTITITKTVGPGTYATSGGAWTYTPILAQVGSVTVTFSATDGFPGGSSTQTFTFTVVSNNTKPNITTGSIPDVHLNHNISQQLTATDDGVGGPLLTWTMAPVAGFTLSSTGLLTSINSTLGPRTLAVTVTDAGGLSDTKTFASNFVPDALPNFATQTYTETVGGVQFFDPSRVRATIDSRLKFNWLDVEATQAEFFSDAPVNSIKGWRAGVTASDAEGDSVNYRVKTNSVFRFGVPFTTTTATNYPNVDLNSGEILWTPNRRRFNLGGGDASLAATLLHDYFPNVAPSGDSLQNRLDPANWSFTIVAQQSIAGVDTPGQFQETTLVIKVEPNDRPYQGKADLIWKTPIVLADLLHGVYYNGGSAVSGVGRPVIQEPQASDTGVVPHTDAPTSQWIWVVGAPGGVNLTFPLGRNDYGLFDPNTNAIDGHQDAIKIDFGYRPETADHLVNGPLTGLVAGTHYPTLDTTSNYPAINIASSLTNGFYNPWIGSAVLSPGNEVVSWAPVRIQYTLGRYIGQSAYKFGLVSEDQYGRMNKGEKSIFPIFGTVFMFNSRYVWLGDTSGTAQGASWDAAPRGGFTATGNTASASPSDQRYVFSYLPKGISHSAGTKEWIDQNVSATYGADLFGRSDGAGAFASGYNNTTFAPPLPNAANYYDASAGAFLTLDGLNAGSFGPFLEPYAANPLNTQLHPAAHAAATPGTAAGATSTYVQFKGGQPDGTGGDPIQVNVTVSGPFSNNTVKAKIVPSNSPYDFFLNNADFFTSANTVSSSDSGYAAPRFMNVPQQGNDASTTLRHFAGQPQSEVNYAQILPGRDVFFSVGNEATTNLGDNASAAVGVGVGQLDTQAPRLRISYTWPTNITNTAAGYPLITDPNIFAERDILEVATPNLSGNARLFFTGNYPAGTSFGVNPTPISIGNGQERGVIATDPNFFGKYGHVDGVVAVADLALTGTLTSNKAPFQPFHVVTDSIWIPNNADLKFNFPSAYSTPAGGSGYTDIPFIGTKGYLDRASAVAAGLGFQQLYANDMNVQNTSNSNLWLQLGNNAGVLSLSGQSLDNNANPALLSTTSGDRIFHLWLKSQKDGTVQNAYATWGGSQLIQGTSLVAKGGITTAPAFTMSAVAGALTDTQAQISFARLNDQLNGVNQPLNSNTGIGAAGWRRTQFVLLSNIMGAPAQFGLASRVRVTQPYVIAADTSLINGSIWDSGARLDDGIPTNSLIVYGVRDRGTKTALNGSTYSNRLGEAGLEPGSPVIAQWWNTYVQSTVFPATDFLDVTDATTLPSVMQNYATEWLPSDFTEVVAINHNFVGKIQAPGSVAADVLQKVYLQAGLIAPKGHTLLASGVRPVVTPVRQLAINDLQSNLANGSIDVGTKLDIFNGNAVNALTGAPAVTAPDYRLFTGNGATDYTLNGYSNLQLTWQPAVNDQRHPSGYIVTIYRVTFVPGGLLVAGTTTARPMAEYRMGHIGGIGAIQTLNLPTLAGIGNTTVPANGTTAFYAVKVRNVWMEGTEGAAGHSFDMGKEPFGVRYPMAYADVLSGVFVARF